MYIRRLVIFLCCSAGLIGHHKNIIAASSLKTSALVRHLIAAADVYVPPNADQPGQPVTISVHLTATGIQREHALQSDLVVLLGFLDLNWRDSRLTWDPLQHHNISVVHLPADRVWLPDITLYNSAFINSYDPRSRAVFPEERQLVSVHSDGTVTWIPRVTFPLSCNTTQNTAADEVHCAIKLASWMYDGSLVDFVTDFDYISHRSDYSDLYSQRVTRYRIVASSAVRNVRYYTCCPEPYPSVDMTFTARRAAASQLRLAWAALRLSFLLIIMR
ncbi:acetylcholine receptor subunit alpha-type acr-16-like [Paramacrobiotus metropolitanus]|uniref:acetylcholine receptor subunit alpha-type acr-16-like n=1 Tax=Paramacrobiotus metropolitanus TaxID=2943436 RepID=UPI0024461966|nr:acetylcholine receptor subunit alpha-type acr-16-like [Paramacrobiotus metropolitanus]